MKLTKEQRAAIESEGKVIVSASAGSGKTFVMIQKLVREIENGVNLENVLAVTFTKKAAAQMKEKLRLAMIEKIKVSEGAARERLKFQLSSVPTADISTIHAFCARLLRAYFYAVGIDGTFDIISADDSLARDLKNRALETLFEKYYEEDDENFLTVLKSFRKKRSDGALRALILEAYESLRINADYIRLLESFQLLYTEDGFAGVCEALKQEYQNDYAVIRRGIDGFASKFESSNKNYAKLFDEMRKSVAVAANGGIFDEKPKFTVTRKPVDSADEKDAGALYSDFREEAAKRYNAIGADFEDIETEKRYFLKSGELVRSFSKLLIDFDAEYTAVKRAENKLDYNDLEHLTLRALNDERIKEEVNSKYECVFVDEYQDVNPVQEQIISLISGGKLFLVGDVKQAIYGFRGSKSKFFSQKQKEFENEGGTALKLSNNFRSSNGVLNFVNPLFSEIMTEGRCGINYARDGVMKGGPDYPPSYGTAELVLFGADEEKEKPQGIYSVMRGTSKIKYSREARAVVGIVEREKERMHYDRDKRTLVKTEYCDICVLVRKRTSSSTAEIVRALTAAGIKVAGAQEGNICTRPEVKNMIDLLSYIDNSLQDIPLTTALLSPLGGFTHDELATIRIASQAKKQKTAFYECCLSYAENTDAIAEKLKKFYANFEELKELCSVCCAADIIDEILQRTGLEAEYSADGGEKLKNVRRLAAEAKDAYLAAFLSELKEGGYNVPVPAQSSSDSVKVMTMHASKGLEFPVVIISDICATYKGKDFGEMPFDDTWGFAPKFHDAENMLTRTTVLRRLVTARAEREERNNEFNLFYVAATRAMCNLYILAKEQKPFNEISANYSRNYAGMFNMEKCMTEPCEPQELEKTERYSAETYMADEKIENMIKAVFMREYEHADSVNLPVKSSASALLNRDKEDRVYDYQMFSGEGETTTDRGIAYHRFLELCDFDIKDSAGIEKELESLVSSKKMDALQANLLDKEELSQILNMPVFAKLNGAQLYREQEFLCRLPAKTMFQTEAEDYVLVQGAIDLFAYLADGVYVIDYKYSGKSDEQLKRDYEKQLALYKAAAAKIAHVDESTIKTVLVNIKTKRQIIL